MRKSRYRKTRHALLKLRKRLVLEHIEAMMREAQKQAEKGKTEIAEKTAKFAKKLARWTGVKFPRKWRYFFCRKCKTFIIPGITARVRIRSRPTPHIVVYCLRCKNYKRIPIDKKQEN